MLVTIDIKPADVRGSTDYLDLDISRSPTAGMVGLDTVEPIAGTTFLLVSANEADVAGLQKPVEMLAPKGRKLRVEVSPDRRGTPAAALDVPWLRADRAGYPPLPLLPSRRLKSTQAG